MKKNECTNSHTGTSDRKPLRTIAFCFFLAMFCVSAYMIIKDAADKGRADKSYSELQSIVSMAEYESALKSETTTAPAATEAPAQQQENAETPKPSRQAVSRDFTVLQEINPEIIGWIRAEGTNIDYPIAKTDNNDFYLTHLYNGDLNGSGTIFADYRNSGDFSDRNTVIYGHHMKNGTMFGSLEEYRDQEFYDANPTMTLYTPDGDFTVELICGTFEDGDYQFVSFDFDSDESLQEYVDSFRSRSTFTADVELQPGDRIISLCTCSYVWRNARFMVIGRLVPVME